MLPNIANFFGISIDVLMGMSQCKEKEYVKTLVEELRQYDLLRDEDKLVKCAEEGLRKYPNNHLLMAWIVYGAQNIDPKRSIELGEYLISNCRDFHILNWVRAELCYAYFKIGRQQDGIRAARQLPDTTQTRQMVLSDLLEGKDLIAHILETDVAKLCYRFKSSILKILNNYEPQKQIELLKKINAVYDAVYETEDFVSALKEKADNHIRIAEIYMNIEDENKAFEHIGKALSYAEKHDEIPYGRPSKAILRRCDNYDYNAILPGKKAHPYGALKEHIVSLVKSKPCFYTISKKV